MEELKDYLDDNFQFLKDYLQENLPEAVYQIPEATYLAWVDMKVCLPDIETYQIFLQIELEYYWKAEMIYL